MEFEVRMVLERETKGAVRYIEVDENGHVIGIAHGACIGTLYIRKSAFRGVPPETISVSVSILI